MQILGCVSHSAGANNREYGSILIGSNDPETAENIAVKLVGEGLAKCRDNCGDAAMKVGF